MQWQSGRRYGTPCYCHLYRRKLCQAQNPSEANLHYCAQSQLNSVRKSMWHHTKDWASYQAAAKHMRATSHLTSPDGEVLRVRAYLDSLTRSMDGAEVAINCLCSLRSCATCWCPDDELADGFNLFMSYPKDELHQWYVTVYTMYVMVFTLLSDVYTIYFIYHYKLGMYIEPNFFWQVSRTFWRSHCSCCSVSLHPGT
jgi:hypothetical protein